MTLEYVEETHPDSEEPPRMLHVSAEIRPGNDLDFTEQVIDALDEAYRELRWAVMHQRSGVGADVVHEFWRRNRGHAFKVTCALMTIDPETAE